jgi:antitoxin component of RelBE/YafQ-DinJ toxin-antitoxin module
VKISVKVDDRIAEEARKAAQAMGRSLNQVVQDYLEQLAGHPRLETELNAFEASAMTSPGRRDGWAFDRDEAHRRG